MGPVIPLHQAQDRGDPAADLAVEPRCVVARSAQVLDPVRAVARLHKVGARRAVNDRADAAAVGAQEVVLHRPAVLAGEGIEGGAHRLVVDGEAELLVAGGDGVGDVVAEEEEDDRAEGEDRDEALGGLDEVGEDSRDDEGVHREECQHEGDRVERRAAGGGAGGRHAPSIGRVQRLN